MKYVPDRTGRFAERPHYEAAELDTLFERVVVGFLKSRHDKVEFPISTEDVTVLIEKDSDDLDVYADLSSYAGNVEGVTEFWPGRRPKVRISAHLSEGENRENRFRTTLTHEFGHVKLHGYLFALAPTGPGLFGATAKPDVIACKRDTILSAARTDWMEWQAGYACGAVLLPASYVKQLADAYKSLSGRFIRNYIAF